MTLNTKHIAGIAAVAVAIAYSLARWRRDPGDSDKRAPVTEQQTPADD
ncbi:MAG: hypothetical protein ACI9YT_001409 [Halobacteriales archaeon]|jgi:hypothetical protein